jgi:hypothetical protein
MSSARLESLTGFSRTDQPPVNDAQHKISKSNSVPIRVHLERHVSSDHRDYAKGCPRERAGDAFEVFRRALSISPPNVAAWATVHSRMRSWATAKVRLNWRNTPLAIAVTELIPTGVVRL